MSPETEVPVTGGNDMANGTTVVDASVHVAAITGLGAETAACSGRRIVRADQLQGDSDRMWAIFMTTPNILTGMGLRVSQQDSGYPTPAR